MQTTCLCLALKKGAELSQALTQIGVLGYSVVKILVCIVFTNNKRVIKYIPVF